MSQKKILITGAAGFIASALILKLLKMGYYVIGIDNHNNYYDPKLKEARIQRFINHPNYVHLRLDIINRVKIEDCFNKYQPNYVINLAAQAGVRYSIENPLAYIDSNILGFTHILECCRQSKIEHLVYASSSSVYGANTSMPYTTHQNVDHPLSLYAASKKANELMSHAYSNLFNIPTTGLRFFTVYGPWGRPDMALFKFTKAILLGESIQVYNNGMHKRDFTYIDDIVDGIICTIEDPATPNLEWNSKQPDPSTSKAPWRIYNIGNNSPVNLLDFIKAIEDAVGKKAKIELLPIQSGDVIDTYANVDDLVKQFQYSPKTTVENGVNNFVKWYREFYKV